MVLGVFTLREVVISLYNGMCEGILDGFQAYALQAC